MECQITEGPVTNLAEYARLPISFQVDRFLAVTQVDGGSGGLILTERAVDQPYIKNYDTIEGNSPTSWAHRWDLSNWCMLSVLIMGHRVGGAPFFLTLRTRYCSSVPRLDFGVSFRMRNSWNMLPIAVAPTPIAAFSKVSSAPSRSCEG